MNEAEKISTAITLIGEVMIKLVSSYPEGSTHFIKNKTFVFRNQNLWWLLDSGELEPVCLDVLYDVVLALLPVKFLHPDSIYESTSPNQNVRESI